MVVVWHGWTEGRDVFDRGVMDPVLVGGQLRGRDERGHRGHGLGGRVEQGRRHRGLGGRVSGLTPRLPGRQGLAAILIVGGLGYGRSPGPLVHLMHGSGMAENKPGFNKDGGSKKSQKLLPEASKPEIWVTLNSRSRICETTLT